MTTYARSSPHRVARPPRRCRQSHRHPPSCVKLSPPDDDFVIRHVRPAPSPNDRSHEVAIVEWGHSAIISALDGAVAAFGPQTSMGASFEVETSPVLARPIDGVGKRGDGDVGAVVFDQMKLPRLDNADEVSGNMVIMTDDAGLSGVAMARIAKISGAAALMIVNTDQDAGDYIYSLEAETEEEEEYAREHVDIPVFMVSLQAGNVITTALATDDMDPGSVSAGAGLPDRVRLYAGGDRPFFEDAVSGDPLVYLIHNMLTADECDGLVSAAEGMYDRVDDVSGGNNYLENLMIPSEGSGGGTTPIAKNIDRVTLWNGGIGGKFWKDIDELTGFPVDHLSDFEINKHTVGSSYGPHFDLNDANGGGEVIFPKPKDANGEPVVIHPVKGLAVVHHNTDEKYNFDRSTLNQEAELTRGVKYVAKKYIYLNPQPRHIRIVLPLIALPFGGKLPRVIISLHNVLIDKFGFQTAEVYFRKIVTMIPVLLLIGIASVVSSFIAGKLKSGGGGGSSDGKKGKDGAPAAASKKSKGKSSKKSD
ncbi:hypothetical protein ACHAW5_010261 [Stephanodiscus triporus]|uniref:Prolyl 4-hydroxylase alpha subunit domain-containing protein n=1 Tax=Stephanodiscus triporus TaxID=2934178 RepID=A0ABD3NAE8_9STRA